MEKLFFFYQGQLYTAQQWKEHLEEMKDADKNNQ